MGWRPYCVVRIIKQANGVTSDIVSSGSRTLMATTGVTVAYLHPPVVMTSNDLTTANANVALRRLTTMSRHHCDNDIMSDTAYA